MMDTRRRNKTDEYVVPRSIPIALEEGEVIAVVEKNKLGEMWKGGLRNSQGFKALLFFDGFPEPSLAFHNILTSFAYISRAFQSTVQFHIRQHRCT